MAVRLLSADVGIILALIVLFLHNTIVLNFAAAGLIILMLYELFKAGTCQVFKKSIIPAFIYGAAMPFMVTGKASEYRFAVTVLFVVVLFMTFIIQHKKMKYSEALFMVGCTLLVSNSMSCLVSLNELDKVHGLMYLVMGLCGAWLADSGAYFAGTFLGRHKLCPEVSPKKTVEGLIGGIVANGLLFMLINYGYSVILPKVSEHAVTVNYIEVFVIGAVLAVVGTIGDLSASVIKRQQGIKDYGNIMPGHGGAMDRFDSVLFVAPCFYAFVSLVNIYK